MMNVLWTAMLSAKKVKRSELVSSDAFFSETVNQSFRLSRFFLVAGLGDTVPHLKSDTLSSWNNFWVTFSFKPRNPLCILNYSTHFCPFPFVLFNSKDRTR